MNNIPRLLLYFSFILGMGGWYVSATGPSIGNDGVVDPSTTNGVSREEHQIIDSEPAIILGFAWMSEGFELVDDTVNCSFDSVFPVGGAITLNAASLYVRQDLFLNGSASFLSTGTVVTTSDIHLSPLEHTETGSLWWDIDGGSLSLRAPTSLSSTWTFSGTFVFNGGGNELMLDHPTSLITLDEGANVTFKNMTITGVNGYNLQARGGGASVTFDNVAMRLSGNYTLTGAAFNVKNDLRIIGKDKTFTYTAPYQANVRTRSRLYVDHGVTFSYDTSFVGAVSDMKTRLSFADATSQFHLNGCTLHVTLTGFKMTTGTLLVENDVIFDIDGTEDYQLMELDSSISTRILAGATMDLRGKLKFV